MILADTHVLIWAVNNDPRLGTAARGTIDAEAARGALCVSAITPWEIALLAHRGRLALGREVGVWIEAALALPGIVLAPIEPMIAVESIQLPGSLRGDPADRFIIATARRHGWPLITADATILSYGAAGHVEVIDAAK
ncbi:MAG TPA: type II toxin-antitoxin system VapC family toxin [Caulobacteraceae bacterium]